MSLPENSSPAFSVITPSLNCRPYLPRNVESVRALRLPKGVTLEHWVIDGASTDGSREWLEAQPDLRWTSEPDHGLSDAVNKGIERACGTWVIWLNADDHIDPAACEIVLNYAARHPDARLFSGDLVILGYNGETEQRIPGRNYHFEDLMNTDFGLNQPSLIIHRDVFRKVGVLDVENKYTMDYEWLLRAVRAFPCVHIPEVLAYYQRRRGSITDAHLVKQFHDFLKIRRKYNQPRFSRTEFAIRFYIATQPLRRITWVRLLVRRIKGLFGRAPLHPIS